jgi:micrococcal nuclease
VRLGLGAALVAALALVVAAASGGVAQHVVARVTDGDTLALASGARVRLVQIDAPETGECYGPAARRELLRLTPPGSRVALEADAALDRVDRYGRLLRYVRRGTLEVNLELVRRGAAAPYFYDGDEGRYAPRLLAAAVAARRQKRGLWGASPGTRLDPYRQVDTGSCGSTPR